MKPHQAHSKYTVAKCACDSKLTCDCGDMKPTRSQIGALGGKAGTGKSKRRGSRKHYAMLQHKAAAKRHANAVKLNRIYTKTIYRKTPPKSILLGGFIENGRLRLADRVDYQPDGRYQITQKWMAVKPGSGYFL